MSAANFDASDEAEEKNDCPSKRTRTVSWQDPVCLLQIECICIIRKM